MILDERSFGLPIHMLRNQFKEWDRDKYWGHYMSSFQFGEKENLNVPLMKCSNAEKRT